MSLQKDFDKTYVEDTKLQAEELVLMEGTSRLHKKLHTFFSCELCLYKQLDVFSKKRKKMFARELASIKDLERLKQGASGSIGLSDAVEASESIVNSFNSLFDSFSPFVLSSFINFHQFSGLPLG